MTTRTRRFVSARSLEPGMRLSNGRLLVAVTVPDGPGFVHVAWRSPATKSGTRSTRFAPHRNVLVRVEES